jgi:hypothetical protein
MVCLQAYKKEIQNHLWGKAFPSDQYMFQSQVNFHGYKADDTCGD